MRQRFNLRTFSLVTAPSAEPVALADVKTFCRVDGTADDALLTSLIATARRACEEYTKRAFITQTWKLVMDGFVQYDIPERGGYSVGPTPCLVDGSLAIKLSREPIQDITSIKTTNTANVQSTVAPATYTLDPSSGRVLLNEGYSWPTDLREYSAVEVTYTCGYGAAGTDVPEPLRQAILQYVYTMYTSKQCSDLPEGVKSLLAPFCAMEAFVA